jgi:hypothetical protein
VAWFILMCNLGNFKQATPGGGGPHALCCWAGMTGSRGEAEYRGTEAEPLDAGILARLSHRGGAGAVCWQGPNWNGGPIV